MILFYRKSPIFLGAAHNQLQLEKMEEVMRTIEKICKRFGVAGVRGLRMLNDRTDQGLMKTRKWDYRRPMLNTRIRRALETLDQKELVEDEVWRVNQMIWFWYHHAISCALWRYFDRFAAEYYSRLAMKYWRRIPNYPNGITQVLFFLIRGRPGRAREWVKKMRLRHLDRKLACEMIEEYRRGTFFEPH